MLRSEDLPARVALSATRLLAQPRGGALHLPLPAAAVSAARLGVYGQDLRPPRAAGAARGPHRLRLREHGVRWARDPARRAAGERHPQTPALDAALGDDVYRRAADLHLDRL